MAVSYTHLDVYKRQVLYGSLLCVCAALLLLAWHYRGFQKKMAALSRMEETFLQDPDRYYADDYPPADSLLERKYQRFLTLISRDRERIRSRSETAREEMTDYYTCLLYTSYTSTAPAAL